MRKIDSTMSEIIIKNISIGDELLIGQVINTNAAWLGEQLPGAGFQLDSALTIGDSEKAIIDAFNACMDADFVLVTGGLGPTADDITKPTVCKFFDTELEFCQAAYDNIVSIFNRRGFQMSERNRGQAMLPKACLPPFNAAHCVYSHFADREGVIRSLKGYEMLDPQKIQVNIVTHEGSYVEKNRLMVRITFVAKNGREMCDILREINEKTSILCDSGENMYIRYTDYEHVLESHKGLFLHE